MNAEVDIVIVGTGVAGLYCALNLPKDKNIMMLSKGPVKESDSYLAQGGICVLREASDYNSFYQDTMKAGHYENNKEAVRQMILQSQEVIRDIIRYDVFFDCENGRLKYTKEGAHSSARIIYHKDETGKEITSKLLARVRECENIRICEFTEMLDLISSNNLCGGVIIKHPDGSIERVAADYVIMATGGIGGLFQSSTNYPHLTGDAIAVAIRHGIELQNMNYIQIHPTTLFTNQSGRRFLISESLRGEGAYLLNHKKERFVDELLPRDLLTNEILKQMKASSANYVWLTVAHLGSKRVKERFPNIYRHCLTQGYDITKEGIPVEPAQHYLMGGIRVDLNGRTSMEHLFAAGETSCNGVHGANRLASNSLLESLVFAKRAAIQIKLSYRSIRDFKPSVDMRKYQNTDKLKEESRQLVLREMERGRNYEQPYNLQIKCG